IPSKRYGDMATYSLIINGHIKQFFYMADYHLLKSGHTILNTFKYLVI
ncbi:MAG: hypothetical protein K0S63_825, partial [Gammaproteobacteria bacterium]|nr:hypothetical protein [Gammaproteobacteria bacterium]